MARKRGRGMAGCWYGIARTATVDRAGAWVEIDDGGTAKVVTGVTEIGEGILTVLAQIAAEELGVRPQDVTIGDNDTARSPEAAHAGATRQTYMIGNVVALASREAFGRLAQVVAKEWDVAPETIEAASGEIWAGGSNHRTTMDKAVHLAKSRGVVPLGSASFGTDTTGLHPVDGAGRPWQAYVFGCQVAEVEVDTVTGEVQVLGIWAAHDVGRAVNPRGVEGQIEGGIVQALGQALMEDYKLENGHTTTPGLAKYILPTSLDVPHVTSIIVEDPDPIGPLGVKGIGEPAMVPTIPAIMNAIYDAVGVRITSLPATPEKVRAALRAKERAEDERRAGGGVAAMLDKPSQAQAVFDADLSAIRALADIVPGPLPTALNAVRFAASIRPQKFVIEGGDETPVTMPRTAYQAVYPDGAIMIDSGMDQATHESFGQGEPYDPAAFAKLKRALDAARMIVLTHFHADHVGGVVTADNFDALVRKTVATAETLSSMMNNPHRPHLKLSESRAEKFICISYGRYYPVAPGMVLIKAPGHSPDMQMVYLKLQSGREYLHSIDAAWNMANIRHVKGKAAPWVKEDVPAVMSQLRWLNELTRNEPQLHILVTHDGELLDRMIGGGAVGSELKI